ncbi:hypothetical protein K503DRAFT_777740, partial [Rhizopogon vinicolor AM-OR11-026]
MSTSGSNRRCGAVMSMRSRKRARIVKKSSSWLDNMLYRRTNSSGVQMPAQVETGTRRRESCGQREPWIL